ncbi:sensor histidine kinase [Paenibacillus dendritiformis]|uniref:sensor histidine kinase n=1 Tax=Paenibacillus dendritiformis TaxID=130049 RepID=UPI00387E1703
MSNRNKLFNLLMKNYIFFSFTLGLIMFGLLGWLAYQLERDMYGARLANLAAGEIVRPNYEEIPSQAIESFDGWVEILNEQLQVMHVKGKKQDQMTAYTEKDLNALLSDQKDKPYLVSLAPFTAHDGQTGYVLVKIPAQYVTPKYELVEMNNAQNKTFTKIMLQTLALFIVFFSLNAYVYSRWTARKITNPLSAVAEAIKNVANGHYCKRLNVKANHEIAQIQEHFNVMADRLEKAEQEKKRLEANKQRMLVDISHDLKTPITTIQGYVEALQLGLIHDEDKKQKTLTLIHDKTQLVAALIEDVFELSKLELPDYPLTTEVSDIAECLREIAAEWYGPFEDKQFIFEYAIPAHEVNIPFNAKLVYRAISNLLANALKYNPEGTRVSLELVERNEEIEITIADNGIGIAEELQDKIFDAFVRGDQSRRSDGGSGLGLTIAKHIVEKHRGRIRLDMLDGGLESTAGGHGTIFRIVLPRK